MTMTMEQQHRQLGVGFDHLSYPGHSPQFSNPWAATSTANSGTHLFPTTLATNNNNNFDALAKQQLARTGSVSMPYSSIPASAPPVSAHSGYATGNYGQHDLLNISQDLINLPRPAYDQNFSTAPSSSMNTYAPTSSPYLNPYGQLSQPQQDTRRLSQQ